MIRQLAEMVMDPFDDVRSLSASLLKASALGTGEFLYSDRLESYIMVAKNRMIRTGRANISDGYARLVELSYHFGSMQHELGTGIFFTPQAVLHDICEGLTLASLNLQMAVTTPQLHGQFSALR